MNVKNLNIELLTEIYDKGVLIIMNSGNHIIGIPDDTKHNAFIIRMPAIVGLDFSSDPPNIVMVQYGYPLIKFDQNKIYPIFPTSIESVVTLQITLAEQYIVFLDKMIGQQKDEESKMKHIFH